MYNFKLNFETGHLTVPGKPSVKPENTFDEQWLFDWLSNNLVNVG